MKFGNLKFHPAIDHEELLIKSVYTSTLNFEPSEILVSEIDPEVSDTLAFCEKYMIPLENTANCVVVQAKREGKSWFAVCMIPGSSRADINGVVKKQLGASKISFAPLDEVVKLTSMDFGAITPIGILPEWPIIVDSSIQDIEKIIIGSGTRKSKLLVSGKLLANLPNALVVDIKKSV